MPSPNAPAIAPHTNSLQTKKLVRLGDGDCGVGLQPPTPAAAAAGGGEGGDAAMGADACGAAIPRGLVRGLGF